MDSKSSQALVVGAGIAGIKAALDLAEAGVMVHLCDSAPVPGGALFSMERWFPDDACGMCKSLPFFTSCQDAQFCLRRGLDHPNINFIPGAEIAKLEGEAGDFTVTVKTKGFAIDPELCIACGLCEEACPVKLERHAGEPVQKRRAAYLANPQMNRKTYIIDEKSCTKCGDCVKICPVKAIELERSDSTLEISAGSIILSTGFEAFDPLSATHYGYRRFPNVVTNLELERLMTGYGSEDLVLRRPSDGKQPRSVAFIQCVGSRDRHNDYCSSACCMYAIREASMVRDHLPGARVAVFYMDMRVFGKDCQAYYDDAEAHEIDFINSRVPLVKQDFSTNDLIISSMSDSGDMLTERFGLVVLSVAQRPSERFAQLGKTLSIEMNRHGFAGSPDLSAVSTSREGIFMCGSASGPMDISGSIAGASAAAGMAMKYVSAAAASPEEDKANPAADTAKTAVFLCDCRGLLSKTLDMGALAEHMKSLPGVEVHLFDNLCAADQRSSMEKIMKESGASGALIGACSIFRPLKAVKDKPAVPVALREEAAWVHEGSAAFEKAKTMMGLAMENLAWRDMRPSVPAGVESRAVILGAGLAGLTAARALADQGLESCIIEKTSQAGGNARHIFTTIDGMDVSARMASLVAEVSDNPLIHIYTGAWLSSIEGNAGAFTCTVKNAEAEDRIDCGAVIVATGGAEFTGALESFGGMKSLVTQRELERLIETKDASLSAMKSMVMIQCAGSRNSERPYCSRVCCSQALKNSLRLKSLYPELSITVLYRDIMSYGLAEEYYTRARESGVVFARHDLDCLPSVTENTGRPEVKARDLSLGADIILHPDLVVISPAICAGEDNENLSLMLGAELTTGGFFRESEAKFRTVESTREGIFICGLAHSPRSMPETITQARAAAQQAASILRQSKLVQRRAVSEVNQRRCSGCLMCVKACPYGARTKHPERPVVVLSEHLCRGCGACAAVCPNEAATQREFSSHQVFSLIDIAL